MNPDGTLDAAFNPNANNVVRAIALQADGHILVGGYFTEIGGRPRNRIARLDPTTGFADSFDPNATGGSGIFTIFVQPDGKILVGGAFTSVGGQTRNNVARLDPTTGLADSFDPNSSYPTGQATVFSFAMARDGKILAAGLFDRIGGQSRRGIARLDPTTGLADRFNANANSNVLSVVVQPDGKILAGGDFSSIGGQARSRIARLDPATGMADSFNPNANGGANPPTSVYSIALQPEGKVLAVGTFTSIGGQPRNRIARLDPATGLADSFNPNANNWISSVAVQPDGKLLVAGAFSTLTPNGGATVIRNHVARLEADGRLDQTLSLNALGEFVAALSVQPDGKVLIGGKFTTVLGVTRNSIARLNADGSLDMTFDPSANDWVLSIVTQPDGKILVGGKFTSIGGQPRNRIARLDPTTGLADAFDPNANGEIYPIALQLDGKILAGGLFSQIGGQPRRSLARLDPISGLADSFDPNPNQFIYSIALQADGKILVGGVFNTIGGQPRNLMARLDPTTGLPDSFNPNANNYVQTIAVQPDGKILVGGQFTNIGGQKRNHIARLDPTTGTADRFNPRSTYSIYSFALQADGKILVGGEFASVGGQSRHNIARLDPATGLADSFNPTAGDVVDAIALRPDGKILVGGEFLGVGGQPRNLFARLTNDVAARQDLVVTDAAVTWVRSGSSPQFKRVAFEYSTDNVTYTSLGNGTAAGSNWTLANLELPIGQNLYVRARGWYSTGFLNNSESITESVRNVFLTGPAGNPTPTPTPSPAGPTPTPAPSSTPTPPGTPTPSPTPTPLMPIDPNNVLVLVRSAGGNKVREFTPAGSLVQTIPFNYNGGAYPVSEILRDIIVDQDGVISAFNGTFAPFLTRYSSSTGKVNHLSFAGWSVVNQIYNGRIASFRNYVFVNDMLTAGGEPTGIVRFDTRNDTAVRFASNSNFGDLTVGMDGNLYTVRYEGVPGTVAVYDPVTLDFLRNIALPAAVTDTGFLSMAADQSGYLYVAGWNGTVFKVAPNGMVLASKATGFDKLTDIELDENGRLLLSAMGGRVIMGDTSLASNFKSFLSEPIFDWTSWPSMVCFARPPSFPGTPAPTPGQNTAVMREMRLPAPETFQGPDPLAGF